MSVISGEHAGTFWATAYSVVSIAITLFNKAVLTSYGFKSSVTLTLLQVRPAVPFCAVLQR